VTKKGEFRWLDSHRDSEAWAQVRAAFHQELEPDDPAKTAPVIAERYKYVSRIGVFGNLDLVIIGERETKESKYGDYFLAYNYDMQTGAKSSVLYASGFMEWKFVKLARLESSPVPDVTFTYLSCTECEAEKFLASFQYDPEHSRWMLRNWGKEKAILVGADAEPVGEIEAQSIDCVFKMKDWHGEGREAVAVRCRTVKRVDGKTKLDEYVTVYNFTDGRLTSTAVRDPGEIKKIYSEICNESAHSDMCKRR
jgi:hypothetical protein